MAETYTILGEVMCFSRQDISHFGDTSERIYSFTLPHFEEDILHIAIGVRRNNAVRFPLQTANPLHGRSGQARGGCGVVTTFYHVWS